MSVFVLTHWTSVVLDLHELTEETDHGSDATLGMLHAVVLCEAAIGFLAIRIACEGIAGNVVGARIGDIVLGLARSWSSLDQSDVGVEGTLRLSLQALNNPTSLEDATGITELKAECDDLSDFDWDSDEDEE